MSERLPPVIAALIMHGDRVQVADLTLETARAIIAAAAAKLETQAAVIRLLDDDVAKAQAERDEAIKRRGEMDAARSLAVYKLDRVRHSLEGFGLSCLPPDAHEVVSCALYRFRNRAEVAERFKAYVHQRLDDAGVPHDPDPSHTRTHGCRIAGRIDWMLGRASFASALAASPTTVATLQIYRERGDCFVVLAEDRSTAEDRAFHVQVLLVIQNDQRHAIQYQAGDEFDCSVSKVIPGASAYADWRLIPIMMPTKRSPPAPSRDNPAYPAEGESVEGPQG